MPTVGDRALSVWTARRDTEWWERTVGDVLSSVAQRRPDRPAVAWLDATGAQSAITYGELAREAQRQARTILTFAAPGDRIAVLSPSTERVVVLFYAAALAGVVLVPLHPNLARAELDHVLAQSRPAALFTVREHRGRDLLALARSAAASSTARVLDLDEWPGDEDPTSTSLPPVDPSDTYVLQYTSGTTGRPKGAMLSHRALLNAARLGSLAVPREPEVVYCCPYPLHHVGGSSVLLGVLCTEGTFLPVPAFDPSLVLRMCTAFSVSRMGTVPTMAFDLMASPDFATTDLGALRYVWCGAAAVPPSLVRRMEREFGARVLVGYGQSESPWITQTAIDDSDVAKAETIGRPLPHRDVVIVRPGTSDPVPVGEIGELCTRSPMTMTGYFGMPDETRATIDAEGWLHTGDLCSMGEDGLIRFHGRARDVIIRGGENVYPAEVEDVLLQHPAVAEAAVVGQPDERWGEVVVAFIRPEPGADPAPEDLRAFTLERLARFKVPVRWIVVADFPRTASGKVVKHELASQL